MSGGGLLRPSFLPDGRAHVPVKFKDEGDGGLDPPAPKNAPPLKTRRADHSGGKARVSSMNGSRKGHVRGVHKVCTSVTLTNDMFDGEPEVASACGHRDFAAAEKIIGHKKAKIVRFKASELVGQIRKRMKNKFFEEPVDPKQAPGYYWSENNTERTKWNTEVMYFRKIEEKDYAALAKKKFGVDRTDMALSLVEHDLNLIVYNAIIYNPRKHPVNLAAQRLFDAIHKVMENNEIQSSSLPGLKWEDCRFCSKCNGDEVYFENPINICDWCCVGTHKDCMQMSRPSHQGHHPLRTAVSHEGVRVKDDAWFCTDSCRTSFEEVAKKFDLPVDNVVPGVTMESPVAYKVTNRIVLARQCKRDNWSFGVTIKPESREQQRAAAAEPRKIIVLWPYHTETGGMTTFWGTVKDEVQDATDDVAANFLSQKSERDRALARKNLEWCRLYVQEEGVPSEGPSGVAKKSSQDMISNVVHGQGEVSKGLTTSGGGVHQGTASPPSMQMLLKKPSGVVESVASGARGGRAGSHAKVPASKASGTLRERRDLETKTTKELTAPAGRGSPASEGPSAATESCQQSGFARKKLPPAVAMGSGTPRGQQSNWALEKQNIRPTSTHMRVDSGHKGLEGGHSVTRAVDAGTRAVPVSAMLQAAATAKSPSREVDEAVNRPASAQSAITRPPLSVSGARSPSPPKPPLRPVVHKAAKDDEAMVSSAPMASTNPAMTATSSVSTDHQSADKNLAVAALMSLRGPMGASRDTRPCPHSLPQPRPGCKAPESTKLIESPGPLSASSSMASHRDAVKVVTASDSQASSGACLSSSLTVGSNVVRVVTAATSTVSPSTAASASSTPAAASCDHRTVSRKSSGGRDCSGGAPEEVPGTKGRGISALKADGSKPGPGDHGRGEGESRDQVRDSESNEEMAELLMGLAPSAAPSAPGEAAAAPMEVHGLSRASESKKRAANDEGEINGAVKARRVGLDASGSAGSKVVVERNGERESVGSEGRKGEVRERRFIGVEKVAGTDEWSCRMNSSLRFQSEEEAAWGHDVICLGSNPLASESELNFAASSDVVKQVLRVLKKIVGEEA